MYTNHRHYILLIFALGAITLTIFGYSFLHRLILAQARDSAQILREVNLIDEKKQRDQDVTSIYTKSAEDRLKLNSYLVPQDKIVNLIEEVEDFGITTNTELELSAITNEDAGVVGGVPFGHFKAHVDGQGTWANILRALILLENMPYSVTLNNIRIISGAESSSANLPIKGAVQKAPAVREWRLTLDLQVLTLK